MVKKLVHAFVVFTMISFQGTYAFAGQGQGQGQGQGHDVIQLKKELSDLKAQKALLERSLNSYRAQRSGAVRGQRAELDARREQVKKDLAFNQLKLKRHQQLLIDAELSKAEEALTKSKKMSFDDCDLMMQKYFHSRINRNSNQSDSMDKIAALSRVQEMNSRALRTLYENPNYSCQQLTSGMKRVPLREIVRLRSALAIEQFAQGGSWLGQFFSSHSAVSYEAKKCAHKIIKDRENQNLLHIMIKSGDLAFAKTGSELFLALSTGAGVADHSDEDLLAELDELMGGRGSPITALQGRGLRVEMAPKGGTLSPGEVPALKGGLVRLGGNAQGRSSEFDVEFAELLTQADLEVEKEMAAQKDSVHHGCPLDGGSFGEVISGTFSPIGSSHLPSVSQRRESTRSQSSASPKIQSFIERFGLSGQSSQGTRAR